MTTETGQIESGQTESGQTAFLHDAYIEWLKQEGVRVHTGYFMEDLRTLELGRWDRRECDAAFLILAGQERVSEAHVIELAPGQTLPPFRMAMEEVIYVVEGRGLTTMWSGDNGPKKTFEWHKHSMFFMPTNHTYQLTNAQGTQRARLLHFSSLPLAMRLIPNADFFFDNPYVDSRYLSGSNGNDFYAEAKAERRTVHAPGGREQTYERNLWFGNFFPDMGAWDKLDPLKGRGAGGHSVNIRFPDPNIMTRAHMSVFPARTYKKAHRHSPGVVIVIPAGEGYSIMWQEGKDKVIIPWHEASIFVPPNRWFHQHFNVGSTPGRYLALHPAAMEPSAERIESTIDQFEYPEEDPFIRQYFEEQLAKRGLTSLMPEEAYKDPNFEWDYAPTGSD